MTDAEHRIHRSMYKKWISNIVQIEAAPRGRDGVDGADGAAAADVRDGAARFSLRALAVSPPGGPARPGGDPGPWRACSAVGDVFEYEWADGVGAVVP
ncbi:MAG: hypothetical protein VXZ39_03035 [Planctomycetota bacterium]|nr:hypothetical protein [Planctomycetota bacterium]